MKMIGIVGAGVMGASVAQAFSQKKYKVILVDLSDEILNNAKENIKNNYRFYRLFNNEKKLEDVDELLNRIEFTTNYERLKNVDFIVENAPENFDIKKDVYEKIDKICNENCIFLVNTSCISITRIAALTKRENKIIGTHFMNPVSQKKVVEVIKGYHTSEETIAKVEKLLNGIEKEAIVVNDYPGFVSNRISHLFMNEAAYVVQDQVSSPENVDYIFKKCFGHTMGPLETADLIGLDTVVNSLDILYASYQDPKFRCCPLLRKMVNAGMYGKKSGKGFYEYNF